MDEDKKLRRKDYIKLIDEYYKSINRTNPPNFREYSNHELRQVAKMFKLTLN